MASVLLSLRRLSFADVNSSFGIRVGVLERKLRNNFASRVVHAPLP